AMLRQFRESKAAELRGPLVQDPLNPSRQAAVVAPTAVSAQLPLAPHLLFTGTADIYNDWVLRTDDADWNRPAELYRVAEHVRVPICHLGAWFDDTLPSVLAAFVSLRERAA